MDSIAKSKAVDRFALFNRTASVMSHGCHAAIVEKDFWVCWALRRIFEVLQFRPYMIFKGGTSLSKAYRAIERFSEDVDLSLSRRDLGFADSRDPEQNGISKTEARRRLDALVAECRNVIREKLVPDLREDFSATLGDVGWSVDLDPGDPQTVIFVYPSTEVSGAVAYVRPSIRLEMGARSDDWPAAEAVITPYAAEAFPDLFKIRSCQVRTLAAERTFWEKATLLHAECHRPPDKPSPERLARHYYDLYRLARQPVAEQALERHELLERVVAHKSFFFCQSWAHYETAWPGTLRLLPAADRLEGLRRDYQSMESMIFGDAPSWDDIVNQLKRLEMRINGMALDLARMAPSPV